MKKPPVGFSINALSMKTGADRRTITKLVQHITPVGKKGAQNLYRLEDVQEKLAVKPDKSLREEKLSEEIRKLKIANDQKQDKLVSRESVLGAIAKCGQQIATLLETKLVQEWPSVVVGLDIPGARVQGKRLADEVLAKIRELKKEWEI